MVAIDEERPQSNGRISHAVSILWHDGDITDEAFKSVVVVVGKDDDLCSNFSGNTTRDEGESMGVDVGENKDGVDMAPGAVWCDESAMVCGCCSAFICVVSRLVDQDRLWCSCEFACVRSRNVVDNFRIFSTMAS